MTRFRNPLPLMAAAAVAAAILGAPNRAQATFQLTLKSGSQTFVITDDGAGDLDPTTGAINVNKTFTNGVQINAKITGDSNATVDQFGNPPGPSDDARMHITAITVKNTGSGQATVSAYLSDDGFATPVGTPLFMSSSASATASGFKSSAGDKITFQTFVDDANNLYGGSEIGPAGSTTTTGVQSSVAIDIATTTTSAIAFSPGTVTDKPVSGSAPFSMTQQLKVTLTGGGNVTFNGQSDVTIAPAPAGFLLVASGLPCLALGFWRRRQRAITQTA